MKHRLLVVARLFVVLSLIAPAGGAMPIGVVADGATPIYLPLIMTTVDPRAGMIRIPAGEFQMGCDSSNPSWGC